MAGVRLLVRDPIKLLGVGVRLGLHRTSHQTADWVAGKPCSFPSVLLVFPALILYSSPCFPRVPGFRKLRLVQGNGKRGPTAFVEFAVSFSILGQLLVWNESGVAVRAWGVSNSLDIIA